MYTIGIDLGGTNIAVGLCDENLNIIDKMSAPTNAHRGAEEITRDMASIASTLISKNGLKLSNISSVGIASPGSIDSKGGIVEYSNNIYMRNFPMVEVFKKYLHLDKVFLANDANAAAYGEALTGSARGAKSTVMITLGTGVGGGVIIDGKIFTGGINGAGAELGHTVIVSGGRQCSCGRRGCLEAYASATALTAMTKEKMSELKLKNIPSALFERENKEGKVSARTAFDAMRMGDKYGEELVNNYIKYLADGITNFINIFQPEIVCIGGGVCNERENLLNPLTELINQDQYTRNNAVKSKIVIATLGNDAGIVGAAGLGRQA